MANVYLRKGWHLLGLVFPAVYYFGLLSKTWTVIVVAVVVAFTVVLEILRFRYPGVAKVFRAVFGRLMRPEEVHTLNATIPYLLATLLILLIFPRVLACAALAFLAFGDAAASLVGRAVGRIRLPRGKTLEGTLACFGVCLLLGWYLLGWKLALVGAGAAALAELASGGVIDNFTVPLAAGAATWLTSFLFNIDLPA